MADVIDRTPAAPAADAALLKVLTKLTGLPETTPLAELLVAANGKVDADEAKAREDAQKEIDELAAKIKDPHVAQFFIKAKEEGKIKDPEGAVNELMELEAGREVLNVFASGAGTIARVNAQLEANNKALEAKVKELEATRPAPKKPSMFAGAFVKPAAATVAVNASAKEPEAAAAAAEAPEPRPRKINMGMGLAAINPANDAKKARHV
jgi:hypothetical protein